MSTHRGRRRIPRPTLPLDLLARPALTAGAVVVVVAGCVVGVTVTRHDPVRVIPVGSVVPLPTPSPSVSPLTGVRRPVPVCWAGGAAVVQVCVTQDPRAVVDGSAVRR
ncbi:hypothetical protein MXD62_13160 [Frankia sp. Mgl5]|uniref:hypothetical protein n=1 Tax=Frankia sp. Mgl5 TaxID=2933793 RepID=UPI0020109865|nr:hypothetical protein [Frankia sp. Mgl5]MCK9928110.1 hypothetical protein [Frankia sp. Mgl5]